MSATAKGGAGSCSRPPKESLSTPGTPMVSRGWCFSKEAQHPPEGPCTEPCSFLATAESSRERFLVAGSGQCLELGREMRRGQRGRPMS
ncbi:hypothetical protein EMPS_01286 [Entomortierella parvispora]|uniref:Uncharacterized protein n=1 Tax=Entomortierella parvispora TaxID=205924 RepID=A0A9P3H2J9_9FUNG|nr:hypothetical protein EMPS_01286 [Entomortierella parvispora]